MSVAYDLLYRVGFTPWRKSPTCRPSTRSSRDCSTARSCAASRRSGPRWTSTAVAGSGVSLSPAVAAPDATLLMMACSPWRRPLLPRGASRRDIEAAYPQWTVPDEHPFDVSGAPFYRRINNAEPRFYRLVHH
jgi:hypothetical protein